MTVKSTLGSGLVIALLATPAIAQDSKFYLQAGIASIDLQDNFSDFTVGGPAADATVTDPNTLLVTGGYMIQDNLSVSFTGGIPAESTATGQGSLAALGTLGEITFGVAGLHLNYHNKVNEQFQPFFGAGLAYGIVFDAEDGALTDVSVENSFGTEIRAGFDYFISDQYGAYFAVSKAFLEFEIEGMAGPDPASVTATLDPLVIQAGFTYRF